MAECFLHLGAHRTGTTLLQEFMYKRRAAAEKHNIKFIEISECRDKRFLTGVIYRTPEGQSCPDKTHQERVFRALESSLACGARVFLSEENILGTMEENLRSKELYPSVTRSITRLGNSVKLFDTVCLSIRPPHEWWLSAIRYLAQKGVMPSELLAASREMNPSEHKWSRVVSEIADVFPHARLVIRDFPSFLSNPKRQLREFTNWPEIKTLKNIEAKKSNSSTLGKQLLASSNAAGILNGRFNDQVLREHELSYLEDLDRIRELVRGRGRLIAPCRAGEVKE